MVLIRECERRIANLTDSLARVGWSEALAAKLHDEEPSPAVPRIVPHPATRYFRLRGGDMSISDQQDRDVAEVWVPFEENVAVGW